MIEEKISNEFLSLTVASRGAEMQSLTRLSDGHEYLWNADAQYWAERAPILFPAVGGLWNDEARFDGQVYHTPRHGFIKRQTFSVKSRTQESITLEHDANEETLAVFPFHYHFEVEYRLEKSMLNITFRVSHTDSDGRTMYFQVGGHPGFSLPGFCPTDDIHGYARLEGDARHVLHTGEQNCLIPGHFDPPALEPNGLLALRDHTTGSSGLIFDHHQLTGVTLLDKEQRPLLRVSCEAAPATLLWAAEAAPFICVEPWFGLCDWGGFRGDYSMRPYVNEVAPGGVWQNGFSIEILNP